VKIQPQWVVTSGEQTNKKTLSVKNRAVYEKIWKNIVESNRPQVGIGRNRFAG